MVEYSEADEVLSCKVKSLSLVIDGGNKSSTASADNDYSGLVRNFLQFEMYGFDETRNLSIISFIDFYHEYLREKFSRNLLTLEHPLSFVLSIKKREIISQNYALKCYELFLVYNTMGTFLKKCWRFLKHIH